MLSEEVPHLQASFDPTVVFGGVTQYIVWMVICWIITLVLILVVGRKLTLIPTNKFVNTVEYGYQFVRNDMGEGIIGHGFKKHVPFLATLFFFILISNFVGLIPGCKTPTGTISVTWALATISFVYFNVWGIKAKGGLTYLKSFAPAGLPKVMVPIIWFLELISTCIRWLTPFLATLFFFILISNFVGLIPGCKTPTGTISVTWALATISFIYFNVWGIKAKGGLTYLKSFAPAGLPKVMVPIIWFLELISTCIRWLTLAVRLYGNMFAGHMVLGIFALASSVFLTCGIQALDPISGVLSLPWFLLLIAMYALETLVAFLQAYVFTVLSAVYVQIATSAH